MRSANETTPSLREPRNMEEVLNLLRFRHERGAWPQVCTNMSLGFGLDGFDLNSWHLGLFESAAGIERPVAYVRVTDNRGVADWRVRRLAENHVENFPALSPAPRGLPILQSWPGRTAAHQAYESVGGDSRRLLEIRWLVATEYRSPVTTLFLAEAVGSAFFFNHDADGAFVMAEEQERPLLKTLGFCAVAETSWVYIAPGAIDPALLHSIRERSRQYRVERCVTAGRPECLTPVRRVA